MAYATQSAPDASWAARSAHDPPPIPTLDGWRAIAITLVMLAHTSDSIAIGLRSWGLDWHVSAQWGLLGVQLFFGLSGFLIATRILHRERQTGQFSVSTFYTKRVFRILPAALVYLLIVAALALAGSLPVSLGQWLSTLLLVSNYTPGPQSWYLGHYWSLTVEEHFYLLLPLLFMGTRSLTQRLRITFVAAWIVALWRALDWHYSLTGASAALFWGRTDIQADSLLWGVWLALLLASAQQRPRLCEILQRPGMVPSLALLVIGIQLINGVIDTRLDFALLSAKAALIPLVILGSTLHVRQPLWAKLEHPALQWLGRHAFSLYLYQQLFLVWNSAALPGWTPFQQFPLNLLLTLACAALSRRYIELPGIAWGRRYLQRRRSTPAPARPHQPGRPLMESLPMRYGFSDSL